MLACRRCAVADYVCRCAAQVGTICARSNCQSLSILCRRSAAVIITRLILECHSAGLMRDLRSTQAIHPASRRLLHCLCNHRIHTLWIILLPCPGAVQWVGLSPTCCIAECIDVLVVHHDCCAVLRVTVLSCLLRRRPAREGQTPHVRGRVQSSAMERFRNSDVRRHGCPDRIPRSLPRYERGASV